MTPATAQSKKARCSCQPWWLVHFACLCSLLRTKKNDLIGFILYLLLMVVVAVARRVGDVNFIG